MARAQVTKQLGKFEKEYTPRPGMELSSASTLVVVSVVVGIRGDKTAKLGNVGGDVRATKAALQVSRGKVKKKKTAHSNQCGTNSYSVSTGACRRCHG